MSVLYAVGVWLVSRHATYFAYVAALDFVVIVVLFGTGRRTELPADLVHSAAPLLARVAKELRKSKKLVAARVRGLGRIPKGTEQPDELRLGVWPKGAIQGFRGIEIGLGWAHAIGQPVALLNVCNAVAGVPAIEDAPPVAVAVLAVVAVPVAVTALVAVGLVRPWCRIRVHLTRRPRIQSIRVSTPDDLPDVTP